ncbi:hypothetical protein [Sulfurospirillum halorespirans]|uniref:RiboL-PSP-HEPN domain-containing protein n=1 Tax=Sulfurospirillum halorespirans DSM 13726 TaxID=1193502 RepID=A0A1D7TIM3_9BACT|nr:hypothetical protein [Sulfurospirillum halorespirans]AOO64837.1 hypothetical protein SHALO_1057 [Sulfurospirillum halorespirans DSM 13726]
MLSYVGANPFELFENLNDDVVKSLQMLEDDKESQFLRRCFVKSAFSYIESIPYYLKYHLRRKLHKVSYELNEKERTLLYEDNDYKITLLDNFKQTFKLAKKMLNKEKFDLKTSGKEFKLLRESIYVRDRITHPKRFRDIQISDKEIYYILTSVNYIEQIFLDFLSYKNINLSD